MAVACPDTSGNEKGKVLLMEKSRIRYSTGVKPVNGEKTRRAAEDYKKLLAGDLGAKSVGAIPLIEKVVVVGFDGIMVESKRKIHLSDAVGPSKSGRAHVGAQINGHVEKAAKWKGCLVPMLSCGSGLGDGKRLLDKAQRVAVSSQGLPMTLIEPSLVGSGEGHGKATQSQLAAANQGEVRLGHNKGFLAF